MRPVFSLVMLAAFALVPVTAHAQFANVDACSLLTASEASTAIGAPANQGHHLIEPSKGECWWSDATTADPDHRRVTLSIIAPIAFNRMKSSPNLKTEVISGAGDEAYYVLPKGGGPILNVRKGGVDLQIKILNGFKVKPPLGADEVKARELVLAKAAAGRA